MLLSLTHTSRQPREAKPTQDFRAWLVSRPQADSRAGHEPPASPADTVSLSEGPRSEGPRSAPASAWWVWVGAERLS